MNESLRAALEFLEKLTLAPERISTHDIQTLLNKGIQKEGVRELLHICFLFNVFTRLADALDFELPGKTGRERVGKAAFWLGYGPAKLPG